MQTEITGRIHTLSLTALDVIERLMLAKPLTAAANADAPLEDHRLRETARRAANDLLRIAAMIFKKPASSRPTPTTPPTASAKKILSPTPPPSPSRSNSDSLGQVTPQSPSPQLSLTPPESPDWQPPRIPGMSLAAAKSHFPELFAPSLNKPKHMGQDSTGRLSP